LSITLTGSCPEALEEALSRAKPETFNSDHETVHGRRRYMPSRELE
jgi:hypothetical protein